MRKLLLATGNPGKVVELTALLARHLDLSQVALLTLQDWPLLLPQVEEDGETFRENALRKAYALTAATGITALADDSGLCVDALGGRPGIHSARWAGPGATDTDRNRLLLRELSDISREQRTAHFLCAIAVASPEGESATAEGRCEGVILSEPRGANGFGYDPLFLLPTVDRTMAELLNAEKNEISHRARAMARIAPDLIAILRLSV